ncbi:MAG: Uma2 family endonuclease [Okeania sp. SIO3I5]|uniref:Uma2 family endonuclease n=1 Tax=Okeania sp. SIO3I5 TaxID=2607805 RepID=UPI0013BE8381|nr:Uma2 family endonuclease [Okeania sp. SIO3I5]NEQ38517.1 Uma2 family endonuclease [Okeania sp. SIO3I5]
MVKELTTDTKPEIIYPDSDGQPMADNTKQFRWIVIIKENLEILFAKVPDVFVAGDLLWYPIKDNNKTRIAPDAMVVFGRPKGDRGSYIQCKEENIAPQVVFEVLSPGNTPKEMRKKLQSYDDYGVEEYYVYDPDKINLTGYIRVGKSLRKIEEVDGWVSPRLGIRFQAAPESLEIYLPDGRKFLTPVELDQAREQAEQRAEQERQRAEQERQRAEQERQRAEQERQRAEQSGKRAEQAEQLADKLAKLLRESGIDPDQIL